MMLGERVDGWCGPAFLTRRKIPFAHLGDTQVTMPPRGVRPVRTQSFLGILEKFPLPGPWGHLCSLGSGHDPRADCLQIALHSRQGAGLISSFKRGNVFCNFSKYPTHMGKNETLPWWAGCLSNLPVIYLNSLGFGTYSSNKYQLSACYTTGMRQWTNPTRPLGASTRWENLTAKLKLGHATSKNKGTRPVF